MISACAPVPHVSLTPEVNSRQGHTLWALGLALLAFAVRAPGLFAGFVFDDTWGMQQRMQTGWSRIPGFFTTDQSAFFGSNFYRPFLNIAYEAIYLCAASRPWAWHLTSILLHVACTLLVFRLALIVVEKRFAAAVAAALFAVHPAHVEAISWASALADPLWTLLALASVLAFLRWMEQGSALWLGASLLAAAASVFTKETAVVMPALLVATVLGLRDRAKPGLPVLVATAPFFALSALFLYLRQSVLHSFAHPLTTISNAQMILTWPAALLFYLRHMLWPPVVVPFYPLQIVDSWKSPEFYLPMLGGVIAATVLLYVLWRAGGSRRGLVCVAWTIIPLAPALYLKAFVPYELVHDRFLYAPLVGFCMSSALVLQWAGERIEAATHYRAFTFISIAVIPLLAIQSMSQAVWWDNNITLFTRALTVTPDNLKALTNLAFEDINAGNTTNAAPLLQHAMQVAPQEPVVLYGMSRLKWLEGDDAAAEQFITRALRTGSRSDMWLHFANVELRLNKLDVAERAAWEAVKMNSDAAGVHFTYGSILLAKGDRAAAVNEFQHELRNYPNSELARDALARIAANGTR